ncbi:MAG: AAA family ATPase [Erysipelotrichaceae bacterium]
MNNFRYYPQTLIKKMDERNELFEDPIFSKYYENLDLRPTHDDFKYMCEKLGIQEEELGYKELNGVDIKGAIEKVREIVKGNEELIDGLGGVFSQYISYLDGLISEKPITLIYGTTGSGKTFTVRQFAKALGINYHSVDCASITPSCYKGDNLEKCLDRISKNKTIEGIVHFDEIDKLIDNNMRDNYNKSTFSEFLTLIDSQVIIGKNKTEKYDTTKALFIFSGSFELAINLRSNRSMSLCQKADNVLDENIQKDKMVAAGVNSEFVGRINLMFKTTAPSIEVVKDLILKGKDLSLESITSDFKKLGIDVTYEDDVVDLIVKKCNFETFGLREVNSQLFKISNKLYSLIIDGNIKTIELSCLNDEYHYEVNSELVQEC